MTMKEASAFAIGSKVLTSYGEGNVVGIREDDGMYEIELDRWTLAQGQSPKLFAQLESLSEIPSAISSTGENAASNDVEKAMAAAAAFKDVAGNLFRAKDFEGSKLKYLEALNAIKHLGEGLDNDKKAIVFELTVPCHNNLALCSLQVHEYHEAAIYARNGIMLVSAIEERIESGKVWQELVARGMTEKKLKNEWKKKSYFLAGKADLMRREYDTSVSNLEEALKLTVHDDSSSTAAAEEAKLKELLQIAIKKRAAELKKQKNTWSKAFEKNSSEQEPTPPPHAATSSSSPSKLSNGNGSKSIETSVPSYGSGSGLGPYDNIFDKGGQGSVEDEEALAAAEEAQRRKAQDETLGWIVGVGVVVCAAAAVTAYYLKAQKR